ncbi:MAG: hypothetical protein LBG80_04465, partial [Bacteroidales bacterium]|nr:hypothetical protein [Bacteroidales bacterium]
MFLLLFQIWFYSCSNDDSDLIIDYDFDLSLEAASEIEIGESFPVNLTIKNVDKRNLNDIELKIPKLNNFNVKTRSTSVEENSSIIISNKELPKISYEIISSEIKDDSICFTVNNGIVTRTITHQIRRTDYVGTFQVITTSGGKVEGVRNKYNIEEEVTITAIPDEGYLFEGFFDLEGEILSTNTEFSFFFNGEQKIYCRFKPKDFNILVNVTIGGTIDGSGIYSYGSTAILKATPEKNYIFDSWSEADSIVSSTPVYSFTVTRDLTVEARFKGVDIAIVANSSPGGSVSGSGTYEYGTTATVVASPDLFYLFGAWYEGTTKISESPSYSFTVTTEKNLEARFNGIPLKLTVN